MVKKSTKSKITLESLNKWNLVMAGLHFAQGIAILILSNSSTLPITTSYLTLNTLASKSGSPVLVQASRTLFDINVAYLIAAFFFIAAVARLVTATIYRPTYEKNLKKGIAKARWIEFSLSAGVMMVVIAMLSGVYDVSSLLMIFGLTSVMGIMGLVMEVFNQTTKKTNWLSLIVGYKAGIIPWIVLVVYALSSYLYGSGIPSFVYWIYGTMFILFGAFGVNSYLQYKKVGKWTNYVYGEQIYLILSLVAQTLLSWQIFFGMLK